MQYHYERPHRSASALSCNSRDWAGSWGAGQSRAGDGSTISGDTCRSTARALPLQPTVLCRQIHNKTTVPLKVWILAGASCFAVCAVLVLSTVAITKWGATSYSGSDRYYSESDTPYTKLNAPEKLLKTTASPSIELDNTIQSDENIKEIKYSILEKLPIFKNIVANREDNKKQQTTTTTTQKQDNLISKKQFYPEHDTTVSHAERKIEKKDQPKTENVNHKLDAILNLNTNMDAPLPVPDFKPTLPDIFDKNKHTNGLKKYDAEFYEDYFYNDENLYEDYMQSTSMTGYLLEKVHELHDWIANDPDFDIFNNNSNSTNRKTGNEFSQVLKALNESIVEGNISIVMNTLKDIYYGDNYTIASNKKIILTNRTDLLSFGILTLDVMLLHNIQLMAWENQEAMRSKMLRDPDVFAFNALFMDPTKVEAKQFEIANHQDMLSHIRRQNYRHEDVLSFGANILENAFDLGMSTARAAIHLGRAYKNTKNLLNQIANKDNVNIQAQVSRNVEANTHVLNHLQTSYNENDNSNGVADSTSGFYTELDCIWHLYCRNLVATAKLNAPYGVMARINGVALRMLSGELSADKALDTLVYEGLTGWTDLNCTDLFPRCSKTNAASVVLDSIMQPMKKSANKS